MISFNPEMLNDSKITCASGFTGRSRTRSRWPSAMYFSAKPYRLTLTRLNSPSGSRLKP